MIRFLQFTYAHLDDDGAYSYTTRVLDAVGARGIWIDDAHHSNILSVVKSLLEGGDQHYYELVVVEKKEFQRLYANRHKGESIEEIRDLLNNDDNWDSL